MKNDTFKTLAELAVLLVVISLVCIAAFKSAHWLWVGVAGAVVWVLALVVGVHQIWQGDKRE